LKGWLREMDMKHALTLEILRTILNIFTQATLATVGLWASFHFEKFWFVIVTMIVVFFTYGIFASPGGKT